MLLIRLQLDGHIAPSVGGDHIRGMPTKVVHRYKPMPPEKRLQDPELDGRGLTFETREHGVLQRGPQTLPLVL